MSVRLLFVAPLLMLAAAPAMAQNVDGDVRCFMVSSVFAQMDKDPKRQQVAFAARYYFLGRLDGRLASPQLKEKMTVQGKLLTPKTLGPTMDGCVKQLAAVEQTFTTIGREVAAAQKNAAAAPKK